MFEDLFTSGLANINNGNSQVPAGQSFYHESNPFTFDIHSKIPPHIDWAKNAVAEKMKTRGLLDELFSPEYISLSTDEYAKLKAENDAGAQAQELAAKTAHYDDSEFVALLNKYREQSGQAPIPPDLPALKQPGITESLVAALTAILSPEHAMDIAATPFQNQERLRQEDYARAMQDYQYKVDRHNDLMRINGIGLEHSLDKANKNFAADLGREQMAREQAFTTARDERGYKQQDDMFAKETKRMFEMADKDTQTRMAFAYLQGAMNPNASAEERQFYAGVVNSIMPGFDIQGYAGKTLAEQASELEMMLARNQDKRAQNQDDRAGQLFPYQLEDAKLNNQASRIKLEYLPQQLQLDLEAARAGIDNVNDTIRSRREGDALTLSEQERAYIGMQQDNARSAMSGLTTTLEGLGVEERALGKELENPTIDPKRKEEVTARLKEIKEQKSGIYDELGSLNSQLKEIDSALKSKGNSGGTGTGDWGAEWLGTKYSYGGGNMRGPGYGKDQGKNIKGFDCSSFVQNVMNKEFGVDIGRTCAAQWATNKMETLSSFKDAQEGDILYWRKGDEWHTAILLYRDGEPWIRHAPQTGAVVRDEPFKDFKTSKKLLGVRRVKRPQKEADSGAVVDLGKFFSSPLGGK